MNPANTNPSQRKATWRRLPVEWLEHPGALPMVCQVQRKQRKTGSGLLSSRLVRRSGLSSSCFSLQPLAFSASRRAFTILELLIVVGIIGFMAAMALPHLAGFGKSNGMTAATRQLLDDVALARQRALVNRSEVCMVFLPPGFWSNNTSSFVNQQMTNLSAHQYAAYALIALRSVGDQPGRPYVHYITDWKYLPQGVYISPFQFITNSPTNYIFTTNTMTGLSNEWYVSAFSTTNFPFPSTYNATTNLYLPYIGFTPSGQLSTNIDQFISLTVGSIFYPTDPNGLPVFESAANLAETPPGNETNNANLIHIDWLTSRAKLERNQF